MADIVTAYFARRLAERGYPTDNIEWRLSYCQGDGMAFYGSIWGAELRALVHRHLTGEGQVRFDALAAVVGGASIEIARNSYGHHYAHSNTMAVNAEVPDPREDDEDIWDRWNKAIDLVVEALAQEVRETSQTLASEGYSIIEALSPVEDNEREFRTRNWCLRIRERECGTTDVGDLDDEDYESLIAGRLRIVDLEGALYEQDAEGIEQTEPVAEWVYGAVFVDVTKHDPTYGHSVRGLVGELVAEARTRRGLHKTRTLPAAA